LRVALIEQAHQITHTDDPDRRAIIHEIAARHKHVFAALQRCERVS
jgi:hypothetical protein